MAKEPLISIIMPTLNSAKTIKLSLESIKKQDWPADKVEVLVCDGGSKDETRQIAKEYGCRIIENPLVMPECAKHVGLLNAKGSIGVYLDSDEVFKNPRALRKRVEFFAANKDSHFLLMGGYEKPAGTTVINDYVNNFSDPFSYFMYGVSADYRYYLSSLARRYQTASDHQDYRLFRLRDNDALPLVDLCAGNTVDLDFVRENFSKEMKDVSIIPNMFTLVMMKTRRFGVLKDDVTIHYTGGTWRKYVNKLRWRVVANLFYVDKVGVGFANRDVFSPTWFKLKKFLFIPFGLTIVLPLLSSIYSAIARKLPVSLMQAPLAFYTAIIIVYYSALKLIGVTPKLTSWGG